MGMAKGLNIFFSNRLEVLYEQLKRCLFGLTSPPLMRRLVVVYGPPMKAWLMLRMAQDPELNVAMGMEFIYLNESFEHLLRLTTSEHRGHFPSVLELALAIEKELRGVIQDFPTLLSEEQEEWLPFLQYLKLNLHALKEKRPLSRKMEKRLIGLSRHLAPLFREYGRFALKMVMKWESPSCHGWQPRLWRRLFEGRMGWTYPARAFLGKGIPSVPLTVHFFSISFLAASEFSFLHDLSEQTAIHCYLLSPCAVFWSDIRSDRESAYLHAYWQQRLGALSSSILYLEEFLRDRNPLLANFGRMGREMASQIEESQALTHAYYVLPQHVTALNQELSIHDDLYLEETQEPLSLLHAIQADLLMMRNPQGSPPTDLEERNSIQLHVAPNARREIEILYHHLLGLIAKNPSLSPRDIIVMAPRIEDYIPYIHSVFGINHRPLTFQVLDLAIQSQSEIAQGFLQLLALCESRWNASELLQLFEHPSFQRRHQFSRSDGLIFQEWVEQAGIHWGNDWLHRNELLRRGHCKQGMAEEAAMGTWEYGVRRLLLGLTTTIDPQTMTPPEVPPCSGVDFSQADLLGRWIGLLHSLKDDLSPLQDETQMTMEDWVNFLNSLLESYFQPNIDDPQSVEEYDDFKEQFEVLGRSAHFFKEALFPFASVKGHFLSLLDTRSMTYREENLQAIRFCSFIPLRSIPAKIVVLIGMHEGAFPRTERPSSLNLMMGNQEVDYCPLSRDYDRYLFLEALHSAHDYFLMSYQGYSKQGSKELQPSLIVEELFAYLDQFYTIQGQKPSERLIFKHPLDPFDERYFLEQGGLSNFSPHDFRVAQAYSDGDKAPSHCFLNDFPLIRQKATFAFNNPIDLKDLSAVARNPVKFHLNKVLEIYLQTEDRKLKTEEPIILSAVDKYRMKQLALEQSIESVLYQAEREGKLPYGLFRSVANRRLKEEVEDIHERLLKESINPAHFFQIEFCHSCQAPIQLRRDRWLFPAVTLHDEEGRQLSIVGKLSHATPQGLVVLSKGTFSDIWKVWPSFLLYSHAVRLSPERWKPQLILTDSSQAKKAFFDDPSRYLKQFIGYYTLCLQHLSPLLPDWIIPILDQDTLSLQNKMGKLFTESFALYQHPDLRWVLNKHRLPRSEKIIHTWKDQAEELVSDIVRFWYSRSNS